MNQDGLNQLRDKISELAQDDIAAQKQTRRELAQEWYKYYVHLSNVHLGLAERNKGLAEQIAKDHGIRISF